MGLASLGYKNLLNIVFEIIQIKAKTVNVINNIIECLISFWSVYICIIYIVGFMEPLFSEDVYFGNFEKVICRFWIFNSSLFG